MGIEFRWISGGKAECGIGGVTIVGEASRVDHVAIIDRLSSHRRAGTLKAVLVDASRAVLPKSPSFSREVWEDLFATVSPCPIAYLPPDGHFSPERLAMIASVQAEWSGKMREFDSFEAARDWCEALVAG
jgi:hypothetical protein